VAKRADGTTVSWGYGSGPDEKVWESNNVTMFAASERAIAVLHTDGTVTTQGPAEFGGDSSAVTASLVNVTKLFSHAVGFAALCGDGRLVAWGEGGDWQSTGEPVVDVVPSFSEFAAVHVDGTVTMVGSQAGAPPKATGVRQLFATLDKSNSFMALLTDGTVEAWSVGLFPMTYDAVSALQGNDILKVFPGSQKFAVLFVNGSAEMIYQDKIPVSARAAGLTGVADITVSADGGFAALLADGTVATWGVASHYSVRGLTDVTRIIPMGWLGSFLALRADGSAEWRSSRNVAGPAPSQLVNVTEVATSKRAIAVLLGDGRVLAWGEATHGGRPSQDVSVLLQEVTGIWGNDGGFAALRQDGSVVAWGAASSQICSPLEGLPIVDMVTSDTTFAALLNDSTVVTWGDWSPSIQSELVGVTGIFSTWDAFAALRSDGTVVTWGDAGTGGDSSEVAAELVGVTNIYATGLAFTALRGDGTAVSWGDYRYFAYADWRVELVNISDIVTTEDAFAALRHDGTVVTWGGEYDDGGDSDEVVPQLEGVTHLYATESAFAALLSDGSVVTWGDSNSGGDSSEVSSELVDVQHIYATESAFAALLSDGSVVTWGNDWGGGDSSVVSSELVDVQHIYANGGAFAALTSDGSVVTWGSDWEGGDSSDVQSKFNRVFTTTLVDNSTGASVNVTTWVGVSHIVGFPGGFAALLNDSSAVIWGRTGMPRDAMIELKDVASIATTGDGAFAALHFDGTVTTGGVTNAGDSSLVQSELVGVTHIFGTYSAFAAWRDDGRIITWGPQPMGAYAGIFLPTESADSIARCI
jgi:alpha-tubulin suppressor-like RCC1 family protein